MVVVVGNGGREWECEVGNKKRKEEETGKWCG